MFDFDGEAKRFRLQSVHPGHTVDEVREHTGFDYDTPDHVPDTPAPDANTLALLRGEVADAVAERYPSFAAKVFGAANAA